MRPRQRAKSPDNHAIGWWLNGASLGDAAPALFIAYNAWSGPVTFTLPAPPNGRHWVRVIDSATADLTTAAAGQSYTAGPRSAFALIAQ